MRKLIVAATLFLLASPAFAANIVQYDPVTNYIVWVAYSVNPTEYIGQANTLISPDLSCCKDVLPQMYWIHDAGLVRAMDAAEQAARDAYDQAQLEAATRQGAKDRIVGYYSEPMFLRAFILVLMDEINLIRSDIDGMSKESNRIADRDRPPRTVQQLKNAMRNKIDAGDADAD